MGDNDDIKRREEKIEIEYGDEYDNRMNIGGVDEGSEDVGEELLYFFY